MASQTYQLVMHKGPNPGKIFELVQDELTIGRDITNRIVINDAEVSRKHARLTLQSGAYVIEDLGSTNGTFVDSQRLIGPHMLRPGRNDHVGGKDHPGI
ncbi:MAG: FHA domain-containing protein [Anaerolineales bacterium]|nr:FHA domain-containing protein [Anaerolineales bacterium]